jgi:major membrane immunogen (membrane-anchored lipoprotein)
MKKIYFVIILATALLACGNKNSAQDEASIIEFGDEKTKEAKFEFEEEVWDFGTITDGEVVEHSFKFKNAGNEPLVIASVKASCGCTVPDYSKEPVKPGKTGIIRVSFDSKGKENAVSKDVTIIANTVPVTSKLEIRAFVKK